MQMRRKDRMPSSSIISYIEVLASDVVLWSFCYILDASLERADLADCHPFLRARICLPSTFPVAVALVLLSSSLPSQGTRK